MIDGWMDQYIDGWIYKMIYESMDLWIDGSINRWIDRWMDLSMEGFIDGLMDRWIYGSMVRWFDGSMDELIGGPVEGRQSQRVCVYEIESEGIFIIGGRTTPFEILQMVCNVNVNVKVDSCFTLYCELVGRLPNLKRWKVSTAHMPGR